MLLRHLALKLHKLREEAEWLFVWDSTWINYAHKVVTNMLTQNGSFHKENLVSVFRKFVHIAIDLLLQCSSMF
jgi:hypothetical protein